VPVPPVREPTRVTSREYAAGAIREELVTNHADPSARGELRPSSAIPAPEVVQYWGFRIAHEMLTAIEQDTLARGVVRDSVMPAMRRSGRVLALRRNPAH
jgi:hypothetical protein